VHARGVEAAEVLRFIRRTAQLLRPRGYRTAPQSTPLATQLLHATGLAYAESRRGHDTIALALCGDRQHQRGDFHEALNSQRSSRPRSSSWCKTTASPSASPLSGQTRHHAALKGIGYGLGSELVDGTIRWDAGSDGRSSRIRQGRQRPVIVRHGRIGWRRIPTPTDASRYRDPADVQRWSNGIRSPD